MFKLENRLGILAKCTQAGLFLTIIVGLIPFFLLASFNHPSGDNYCYTNVFNDPSIDNVLEGVIDWYRRWNGRYFSLLLIGSYFFYFDMIDTYRYVPYVLFLGWCFTSFYLLRSIIGTSGKFVHALGGTLGLCALYVLTMPLVSNGFYHVTGAFQYQTGNILLMATMACMIQIGLTRHPYPYVLIAALLIFSVVGSTELHMAYMLILLTTVTLYVFATKNRNRHFWIFLLVVTLLSAALLILAPGNEGRGQHFEARHQLGFSVRESVEHLIIWSSTWFREPLFWLVTVVSVPWLRNITGQSAFCRKIRWFHFAIYLPCWILSLFACFFIAFWSMGVGLPERALNVVYFMFLIGWFFLLLAGISIWSHRRIERNVQRNSRIIPQAIVIIVSIIMGYELLNTEGFQTAYTDLFVRAQKYDEIFQARYRQMASAKLTNNKIQMVKVPEVWLEERPSTIMVDDIRTDKRDFRNQCYSIYFGIPAIETARDNYFWEQSRPILFKDTNGIALSEYAFYVFDYPDLKNAWEESGENIDTWGAQHWTSYGQNEGRKIPFKRSENAKTLVLRRQTNDTIDQVSCTVKGVIPDGRPDLLFTLDIDIPVDEGVLEAITHIRLNRSMPGETYQSTGGNHVLGISSHRDGPLLNDRKGQIRIDDPIAEQRLWLFSCADGHETHNSIYFAEAQFQRWAN